MSTTNFLYNPERKGKQQLIAEFVIRQPILEDIMKDLETSTMKTPEQHYLLVGQRGTGKTTLLNRIKYAIEDSSKLKDWLIPVIFSEEQYNIGNLANLWENVGQILEDYYGFDGLYDEMEKFIASPDFEERCRDILEGELEKKGKKLVLLIDNVGDLLKKLDELEVKRLRMILQTKSYVRLIAGSPLYLESILDYKQPLFEFFKVIRLEGLNGEETRELLLKLGAVYQEKEKIERIIKETPERIETLRTLTGGVPRTIALMFNIFIEHEHENSLKDLERILDAVTALYKHRMDDLPPQQQKIVDAVARNWDPISVKDLRERVRLEGKVISAQLRQLEKNQVVQKMKTGTKNHEYILKERFFNIWYLMRYGRRDDKQRVIWLVRFLESWCTDEEISKRVMYFIEAIKAKSIAENNIDFFSKVYSSISDLNTLSKILLEENLQPVYSKEIKYSDEELEEVICESFEVRDYERFFRMLTRVPNLTRVHLDMLFKLTDQGSEDKEIAARFSNSLVELLSTRYEEKEKFTSAVTIFSVVASYKPSVHIISCLEENKIEEAIVATKTYFEQMGQVYLVFQRLRNDSNDFGSDIIPILIILKRFYLKGMINSIRKIFNEAYVSHQNQKVSFSEIFNPIYLALNSLGSKAKTINLAPEKEQLVQQIRDIITATDK